MDRLKIARAYAVIARFHSGITDGMTAVIAGLGRQGTHTAGEFASTASKYDWEGNNFEAILKIDIIQGSAGHVEVVATRFFGEARLKLELMSEISGSNLDDQPKI
jgi:hypothetical protein